MARLRKSCGCPSSAPRSLRSSTRATAASAQAGPVTPRSSSTETQAAPTHLPTRSAAASRSTGSRGTPSEPANSGSSKRSTTKRRCRPGTKALKEIRRYQRGTNLLIPRRPFQRAVRQVSGELIRQTGAFRFTQEAMECLQVAAEAFIIQLFEDSILVVVNAKRVTLMDRDMQLVRRIRGL